MEPHIGSILLNTTAIAGENRALMANAGNFSLTFVPLLSLVATFVPRIVSRIKTLRPTQTTSGRGFRNPKFYAKNNLDFQFCNSEEIFEAKLFPGFTDVFYICKLSKESKNDCNGKKENHSNDELHLLEKLKIGKIVGMNDCFYLQLYKCNEGFYFDPEKKKCTTRSNNM